MWRLRTVLVATTVVAALLVASGTASASNGAKRKPRHKGSSTIIVTPIVTTTTLPLSLTAPSAPVDLTITGTSPLTVRGSKALCLSPPFPEKARISLEDYPETGGSGFLEFGTGTPKFSGAIGTSIYYANSAPPTAVVHDGTTWTINGLTATAGTNSITIWGRILCP